MAILAEFMILAFPRVDVSCLIRSRLLVAYGFVLTAYSMRSATERCVCFFGDHQHGRLIQAMSSTCMLGSSPLLELINNIAKAHAGVSVFAAVSQIHIRATVMQAGVQCPTRSPWVLYPRGSLIREFMKQAPGQPYSVVQQVALIYTATRTSVLDGVNDIPAGGFRRQVFVGLGKRHVVNSYRGTEMSGGEGSS